jgi:putative FmdB family regulatory protein
VILYSFRCDSCAHEQDELRNAGETSPTKCDLCGGVSFRCFTPFHSPGLNADSATKERYARADSGQTRIITAHEHRGLDEAHQHANYKVGTLKPANIKEI